MKYSLTFKCRNCVEVPKHYNNILQAALFTWMGENDNGEYYDKSFGEIDVIKRMYTFSGIMGHSEYDAIRDKLIFFAEIQIVLSLAADETHDRVLHNIREGRPLRMGREYLDLINCAVINEEYSDFCVVETLSPISIHSTYEKEDGRKRTFYYPPYHEDFSSMIRDDLIFKYETLYGKLPEDDYFEIEPAGPDKIFQVTVWYNNFFIRGWHGQYILKGSPELIRMGLLAGIGARNNMGMGCVVQI